MSAPVSQVLFILPSSTGEVAFAGAQLKLLGDQNRTTSQTRAPIVFEATQFDTGGFWSAANPTKIIIPAKYNGWWAIFRGTATFDNVANSGDAQDLQILRGGAAFDGMGRARTTKNVGLMGTNSLCDVNTSSHPVQLVTAQEFTLEYRSSDPITDIKAGHTTFSIEILGPTFIGCVLKQSVAQTARNMPAYPLVGFNTEVVNDDGAGGSLHDNTISNSRITITPALHGRMGIFRGTISISAIGANAVIQVGFNKNGAAFVEGTHQLNRNGNADTTHWTEVETAPVLLEAGHYYDFYGGAGAGSATNATWDVAGTCFSLQVLPVSTQSVLCRLSADKLTQNYTTAAAIAFDGTNRRNTTPSSHDPANNNTQIIIDEVLDGKFAVFHGYINMANLTSGSACAVDFLRNAAVWDGYGGFSMDPANFGSGAILARSNIAQLGAGQAYTMRHHCGDNSTTLPTLATFFGMRVLGTPAFNPDIPPIDNIPGVTCAVSASRYLLSGFSPSAKYALVTGAISSANDQTVNARNIIQNTVAARGTIEPAGPNNRDAFSFDGSDDYLTGSATALSTLMSASTGYVICSFVIDAITTNAANVYENEAVFSDGGNWMGVFLRNASGVYTLQGYNFDTTTDAPPAHNVSLNTPYVVEWWHENGYLCTRLNRGSWHLVASGNTAFVTNPIILGAEITAGGGFNYADIRIVDFATFNIPPDNATKNALALNFLNYIGGTQVARDPESVRLDQQYVEVVSSGNPASSKVRLDQQYVEVISSGASKVRLDQQYTEVVSSGAPKVRLAQQYIEVITNN